MTKEQALPYVSFIADDALSFRDKGTEIIHPKAVFIGWQCGFEPLFVAVQSYMGCQIDEQDAIDYATEGLPERNWFSDNEIKEPDYIIS